jgi:hypothetical protein
MQTRVIFTYDEPSSKWEVVVVGVTDENDARDAFAAVVATSRMIDFRLQNHAPVEVQDGVLEVVEAPDAMSMARSFKITPAVIG